MKSEPEQQDKAAAGGGAAVRAGGAAQAPGPEEPPVQLDVSLCKACGICIELCPAHVFDATDMGEAVVARPEDCTLCLLCELHCPDFAIEVRRREKKGAEAAEDGAQAPAEDADEPDEEHAGRVFAALAGAKGDRAGEVTGDQHVTHHEEN